MQRWVNLLLLLIALCVGGLLGILNQSPTAIDLLFVQVQLPLGLALSLALVLGLFLGALGLWLFRVLPLRRQLWRLRRDMRQQQNIPNTQKLPAASTQSPLLGEVTGA